MELIIKSGHQTEVMGAFISADGKYMVSVEEDEVAILWDMTSSKQIKVFKDIIAADFGADGKSLEVVTNQYQFQTISFSGDVIRKYGQPHKGLNKNNRLDFEYDSKLGVLLVDYNLHHRERGLFAVLQGYPRTYASGLQMAATGNKVTNEVSLYAAPFNIVKKVLKIDLGKDQQLRFIRISPDGKLLIAGSFSSFNVIDIESGVIKNTFNYPLKSLYNAIFSPDSKKIAVLTSSKIILYPIDGKQPIWESLQSKIRIGLYGAYCGIINFSPDGTQILAGGGKYLLALNASTGEYKNEFFGTVANWLDGHKITRDYQNLIIKSGRKNLLNWNLLSGKMEKPVPLQDLATLFQVDNDGTAFYKLNNKEYLEGLDQNGKTKGQFISPEVRNGERSLSLSFDGKYILYAGDDYYCEDCENRSMAKLELFDVKTRKRLLLKNDLSTAAFAQTTNRFAAVNTRGKTTDVNFYDMPTGALTFKVSLEGSIYGASQLLFSPKDKYFALSTASGHYLIEPLTKKIVRLSWEMVGRTTMSNAFTPDEKYYLVGNGDGQILFYDIAAGRFDSSKTIKAHPNAIYGLSLSKDGSYLFSSAQEYVIKLWSLKTLALMATLYPNPLTSDWAVITPDGRFDASATAQDDMYFIRGLDVYPLSVLYEQFYTPKLLPRLLAGEQLPPVEININAIKKAPKVKLSYAELIRNLNVIEDKNPVYQNQTGKAEITVNAMVEDDEISEVRLFQNGKIVNLATRGLFVTDATTGVTVKKYTVDLLPGKNRFRAIALNSQRTESLPDDIEVVYNGTVKPVGQPLPSDPRKDNGAIDVIDKNATMHIIVVGINAYKNTKMSLNYALPDATAFKTEIEKSAKSIMKNVKTYFVTDEKADDNGINAAFKEVQMLAKPQDVFVFYYAGHGVISERNKEFYLVPANITNLSQVDDELAQKGIASKKLQEYAVNIQAQKQVFILDACQSAGAFEKLMQNDANQQKSLALVARRTGTHWLAASGSQQFAQEFSQLGHGAFTYILLKALQGEAAVNKMVTVNGLKNFLQLNFPALMKKYNGNQQFPVSYGLGKDFPIEISPN